MWEGVLYEFGVGVIDILMTVVENRVLIIDSAAPVLVEGDVMIQSPLYSPLDGLCEFEGTEAKCSAHGGRKGAHLNGLRVTVRVSLSESHFSDFFALGEDFAVID